MKRDIAWLTAISQDSELIDFKYSYNLLYFKLRLFEHDGYCAVNIKSDNFIFNVIPPRTDGSYGVCFFEVEKIADIISTQHGFYIPENSFIKIMEARRMNYTLAYGLKAIEYPYMLNLRGSHRLLSCLVLNLSDVEIEHLE